MTLKDRLAEYVRACFTGLWIESHEHEDALREMAQLCAEQDWQLMTLNIDSGLSASGQSGDVEPSASDPLAAIRTLRSASSDTATLLVLSNFHRFLNSAEIVQALAEQLVSGKQTRTFIVVLSPVVAIPVELEKLFVVVEHQLPDREQLHDIATGIAAEDGELPTGAELDTVLDAACGLTRYEAENAFSLSLVRHNRITSEAVWELKSGMLKKSGLLELHRGQDDFEALGGLNSLKSFCNRSLLQPGRGNPLKRPRGVLLLGVPGTGKSAFAKALGRETGRPTLRRLGSLYSAADYPASLQGLFSVDWDFPSVEPPEYLQRLNPELYEQECERVRSRFDEAVRLAEAAFTDEFAQLVSHLCERLNGEADGRQKVFRNSAVGNLRDFFGRFRSLNVGTNAELDRLVDQAQQVVSGVRPQSLRDNAELRQNVATKLSGVQSVLDGLLVDRPRRNIIRKPR